MTVVSIGAIVSAQEPPKMWVPYITPTHALEAPLSPIELPPQMPPEAQNALVSAVTTEVVSSSSVAEMIKTEAKLAGVDSDLALAIARAESGFDPKAKNPTSSAKGVYQWIDDSWERFCKPLGFMDVLNAEENIKCAIIILKNGGVSHWESSRHLWSKYWGG